MKTHLLLATSFLLVAALPVATRAQSPTALAPARNGLAAPRATAVQATFAQVPTGTGLAVFSAQAGGKKAGTVATTGNTIAFTPTTAFKPGETVMATLTAASGPGHVWQFSAATSAGTGVFSGGSDISVAQPNMAIGDLDGDGDLDVVVPSNSYNLKLQLSNGDGTFIERNLSTGVYLVNQLLLGDIDNDGDLDLLAARDPTGATNVVVFRNEGSGAFAAPSPVVGVGSLSGMNALALGDLDADGDLDLLVSPGQTGSLADVRFNNGAGVFANPVSIAAPEAARRFTLADLDGDGDLDVLMSHFSGLTSVRLNNGTGTAFTAAANIPESGYTGASALGDVDGDGDLDLLISSSATRSINLWRNNGSGAFASSASGLTGSLIAELALGDVDGDGDLDLVFLGSSTPTLKVSLNNGTGDFGAASGIDVGPFSNRLLALHDMNNDGTLDLVLNTYNNINGQLVNQLSVRLNAPLTPTSTKTGVATAFQVWPNPAGAGAALRLQLPDAAPATYQLRNLLGQTVREQSVSGGRATIARANLPAGVYLLRVQTAGRLPATRRVILD